MSATPRAPVPRATFTEYLNGPLKALDRNGDPGLEELHPKIASLVRDRLMRTTHIDSLDALLLWARERWPTWYQRKDVSRRARSSWQTLDMCMRILWADYLLWSEVES